LVGCCSDQYQLSVPVFFCADHRIQLEKAEIMHKGENRITTKLRVGTDDSKRTDHPSDNQADTWAPYGSLYCKRKQLKLKTVPSEMTARQPWWSTG
jgi:hypothetical protein